MACGLALGLSNSRYAACVLAQSPHASLIGEDGDLASCSAVLIKRRSRRLSDRSAPANSWVTHSTDSCAGLDDSLHLRIFPSRRLRQADHYSSSHVATKTRLANVRRCVQRSLYAASRTSAECSKLVWNRQDITDYIESFYNPKRRHSHLGGVSPDDFEAAAKHNRGPVH